MMGLEAWLTRQIRYVLDRLEDDALVDSRVSFVDARERVYALAAGEQ